MFGIGVAGPDDSKQSATEVKKTLLIDTAESVFRFGLARKDLAQWSGRGDDCAIDYLMLTHSDEDHVKGTSQLVSDAAFF
jgi:beta-lactamase superfamily II metal-dependent hydrolase